jgi:hypothetical protein
MIGLALSPEQFQTLLRMVYVANTVANGNRSEDDLLKDYEELEQYIFSRAKETAFPGATWQHKVGDEVHHHPSLAFEHDPEVNKILDEYEAVVLFELIAHKLAERAIEKKYGPNAKDRMPAKDLEELIEESAEDYQKILLDDGYTNLVVEIKE